MILNGIRLGSDPSGAGDWVDRVRIDQESYGRKVELWSDAIPQEPVAERVHWWALAERIPLADIIYVDTNLARCNEVKSRSVEIAVVHLRLEGEPEHFVRHLWALDRPPRSHDMPPFALERLNSERLSEIAATLSIPQQILLAVSAAQRSHGDQMSCVIGGSDAHGRRGN